MIQAKSDLFFRYLLGREQDEDLRVDFINSVLADAGQPLITRGSSYVISRTTDINA